LGFYARRPKLAIANDLGTRNDRRSQPLCGPTRAIAARRNFPHVLLRDGEIVGGVRIDLIGRSRAGLHLVASGAISSGKATTASRPGLRKTPRAFWQNRDHHRCPPTSPLSTSPMAIGRVNGGRRTATGDPHSRGKAIAVIKASRRSTTAAGEFPDRVVGVTDASNRPQSPPLRGH